MLTLDKITNIKSALNSAPEKFWTAELHLQIIKYAKDLNTISGEEFCEKVGVKSSFKAEVNKMKKIADRLILAGLNVNKI